MSSETVIAVEGLSKYYHMYDRPQDRLKQSILPRVQRLFGRPPTQYGRMFWALKDVTFDVERGESLGIIGRNGSGKSTLLQMVCGTLTPSAGTVSVQGRVAALLELGSGFNPEFTGRENVYMNGAVLGLERDVIDEKFASIAAFAGIGDFIEQPVKTYSSGMVVRLAFAVSVCVDPDVLVVDEALSVGDMAFQQRCMQRLRELREAGTTLVLVTHDIMLTRNYCTRVIYLEAGQVKTIGDAETVGETYLKDTLADITPGDGAGAIAWKGTGALRFGTNRGAILSSALTGESGPGPVFRSGERLTVTVEARIAADVQHPELIVQIRDARGYVLYGTPTSPDVLTVRPDEDGAVITAAVEVPVTLGSGSYAISLGLVERLGETVVTVLDKIVAVLPFTVRQPRERRFHGPVDLDASWRRP